MLIACWSIKGGSGTTVVAASLSLLLARNEPTGTLLADLAGDVPATLGMAEPRGHAGLAGWLRAGEDVPTDALSRLEVDATPGLSLLPRGPGPLAPQRAGALGATLERSRRPVVVDCGNLARNHACPTAADLAHRATRSLLVIRPCSVSLVLAADGMVIRPTGTIIVGGSRTLDRHEVERAVGAPTLGHIQDDPAVTRAVNAGLLSAKLPRALVRGLRHVV